MEKIENKLTVIYKELFNKIEELEYSLNHKIYDFEIDLMFSSLMQYEDEAVNDVFYPVLVLKIKNLCDVELWFDKMIITARMNINDLINYDIKKLNIFNYDLYGCREYPYMFYNKNMNINLYDKLKELKEMDEKEIGIQIYLNKDIEKEEFNKCINFLKKQEIFYYNKKNRY